MSSSEVERKDFHSYLGSLSRRLQLYGMSLIGMDATIDEPVVELGDVLYQEAKRLELAREVLCDRCRLEEVVEKIEVAKSSNRRRKK